MLERAGLLAARKTKHRPLPHARTGPALRNRLALGVEAHRVRAVGVQVAKEAALPAAKRVVGQLSGSPVVRVCTACLAFAIWRPLLVHFSTEQ